MDDPQRIWQEINLFITKALGWLVWIIMGVAAKIAVDSRTERLSRRKIIIKAVLSIFVGALAAVICENKGYEDWGKVIVPVCTLIGEGVVVYIMTNWKRLGEKFLPSIFKNGHNRPE